MLIFSGNLQKLQVEPVYVWGVGGIIGLFSGMWGEVGAYTSLHKPMFLLSLGWYLFSTVTLFFSYQREQIQQIRTFAPEFLVDYFKKK